jgi:hypothetical protein
MGHSVSAAAISDEILNLKVKEILDTYCIEIV